MAGYQEIVLANGKKDSLTQKSMVGRRFGCGRRNRN